jgi:hydroxymethylpyrimidine pyrophosphatase-like HAD family hydrolase
VGDSGTKVNEKSLLQLQVHNQAGKKQGLLTGRDPEELRWLAWTLNQALGLEGRLTAAASATKFPLQKP